MAKDGGWGEGWNADVPFTTTDVRCEGISKEGQQAIALLKVTATAGKTQFLGRNTPGEADTSYIDPFRSKWIPAAVPFEIDVAAQYRLYDSGWRFEAFSIKGGRAK